ncbi:MAG: hypothetical protein KC729_10060, partial [Candidatus Eisenbacteria bacterium]|nr:hypothetical protein [Candidatus Eisenbacteria bacterium]
MAENRPEPEEIDLWRLAAEVADGRGVDWRNHHPSDPDASWMEDLRAIEALAEAMRRPPQPVAPAPRIAA